MRNTVCKRCGMVPNDQGHLLVQISDIPALRASATPTTGRRRAETFARQSLSANARSRCHIITRTRLRMRAPAESFSTPIEEKTNMAMLPKCQTWRCGATVVGVGVAHLWFPQIAFEHYLQAPGRFRQKTPAQDKLSLRGECGWSRCVESWSRQRGTQRGVPNYHRIAQRIPANRMEASLGMAII